MYNKCINFLKVKKELVPFKKHKTRTKQDSKSIHSNDMKRSSIVRREKRKKRKKNMGKRERERGKDKTTFAFCTIIGKGEIEK
jgi:hypothetical protein